MTTITNTITPTFRDQSADYVFVVDGSGSIIRVVYPTGDAFLRRSQDD
ncbi:hypothetical protein Q31b_42370 [Novipirellula aureliae]|uniref:Uncharacterized protein n=1 Tax=Novipirellula aureliae TaxID=2527966 RepID=A0A5C6DR74_9BACT|nr:hypothetical protein [Novipirellula aureliae]TWU39152.1 hypothetical protein Q31b_42370 [Novipirellula aureliae]